MTETTEFSGGQDTAERTPTDHRAAIRAYARRMADEAPPLTEEQRTRLAALLTPAAGGGRDAS